VSREMGEPRETLDLPREVYSAGLVRDLPVLFLLCTPHLEGFPLHLHCQIMLNQERPRSQLSPMV